MTAVMRLPIVDMKHERAVVGEQAVCLLQARLDKAGKVHETVLIARLRDDLAAMSALRIRAGHRPARRRRCDPLRAAPGRC